MAGDSAKIQVGFRYAFGVISPLVLSLVMVFAAIFFHDYRQVQQQNYMRQTWEEKAEITMAAVRSNLTFSDQFTRFGNNLNSEIEQLGAASFTPALLDHAINRHFPRGFVGTDTMTWAFALSSNSVEALPEGGFEKTRLRIMERLLKSLLELSNNVDITSSQISRNEKTIKNILGPHSAPLQLGRQREGHLTPVMFESRPCYIYWRQFKTGEQTFAGWLALVPAKTVEDISFSMRYIAGRAIEESRRHLAVAFVPGKGMEQRLPVILPEQFDNNAEYSQAITELLKQIPDPYLSETTYPSDQQDKKSRSVELADHLFLRDFTTIDIPYDAVVFAPRSRGLNKAKTSPGPILASVLSVWLIIFIYFYYKNGRVGLPLPVAFRILFMFSGFLPIFLMLSLAHGLIEDSYSSALIELRQENTGKLARINEKSDNLLQLYGSNISLAINELKLQPLLTSNRSEDARKAFDLARGHLEKIELALDYLYVFVPGGISELMIHDQRHYNKFKTLMDLFGPSIYQLNKRYAEFWSLPDIRLDGSQKNFHKILSGFHSSFLEEIFIYSYEKEIAMKFGESSSDFFYSVVFSDKGRIQSYVGFAANSERLFRKFLERELNAMNAAGSTIFLAAEELNNSDFTTFPYRKMNALNGQIGKKAMNFITKCRSSLFEKHITDLEHLYIFYPMRNMHKYAGGCVVSLAGINRERSLKRLALFAITVLLTCMMYVMASFATSHMLTPLDEINKTLQKISNGNLGSRIEFTRSDELGKLGTAINLMLEGFKHRLRLGKFVSTTLEKSLASNASLEESIKARSVTGTVLFSDIRSFTTLSENWPPDEIAAMLNYHLETMSESVQQFGGQVEQFIGDAIVAFFPDMDSGDSKTRAVCAAIAMFNAHQAINAARAARNQFEYAIGTGLAHGRIIAGPLITPTRSEFCFIGSAKSEAELYEQQSKLGRHTRIVVAPAFSSVIAEISGIDCAALATTGLLELRVKEADK